MKTRVQYSIVVPVYNSEGTLSELHTQLSKVLTSLREPYEIVLVDDGSTDRSWQVLKNIRSKDENVKIIRLTRNFGQHIALLCGLKQSRGEKVITLDDDLQNPPEEIPKLLAKLSEGHDVVYGVWDKKKQPLPRRVLSTIGRKTLHIITGIDATEITTFRAMRRRPIVATLVSTKPRYINIGVMIALETEKATTVNVEHHARGDGKSNYDLRRLIRFAYTFAMAAYSPHLPWIPTPKNLPYTISEADGLE